MAAAYLNRDSLQAFRRRLEALRPDSARLWGRMEAAEMLAHLTRSIELSLEEFHVEDKGNWLTKLVGPWLVFHLLPWPKGRIKGPAEYFPASHEEFEVERKKAIEAFERFVAAAEKEPERTGLSPYFGDLTLRYWQRVHGMHSDHHLRQFGV